MRGGFRGEWWTESSWAESIGKPLAIAVAVIVVVSWLATVLWILAILLGIVAALALAGVIVLRRTSGRDRELLAARAAAVRAEAEQDRQVTAPKSLTVINVQAGAHMHITSGESAPGIVQQAPVRGAVIRRGQRPG